MSVTLDSLDEHFANPLDLCEQIASAQNWIFDRSSDEDLAVEVKGHWCDFRMFLTWHPDVRALLFACAYDTRVPRYRRKAVVELISMINEKLLVGHFDIWTEDGLPVFRHSILLRGMPGASVEQVEDLLDIAITECERYFPAFQFVIWGGRDPRDALEAAVLETVGEA